MSNFKITREMVENAKTYMPLAEKMNLSKHIAKLCLKDMRTSEETKVGEEIIALPYIKVENVFLKSILLLNTLLNFYFNISIDKTKDVYEQYDYYNSNKIINQINVWKSDDELKTTCCALLDDYKEFERFVNTEIYNLKTVNNDSLTRFIAGITVLSSPENIKYVAKELKNLNMEYTDNLKGKNNV